MVFLRQFLKWMVAIATITAAALFGANKLEASFERALICGREVAPITGRAAVDVQSYEADNMSLARSVPLLADVQPQQVSHDPYHRCQNGHINGDIVGVRSSFAIVLPADSDSCTVMASLARDLEASGWSVYTWDGAEVEGEGAIHAMQAARQSEQLELRFDGHAGKLGVVADHDAPIEFVALFASAPTSCL